MTTSEILTPGSLRSLIDNMLDGFAYCQMHYENGKPIDFTYLDVNPAFENLTGLKGVGGKSVSEVIPEIRKTNPELFEIYGRVAASGKAEKFQTYLPKLDIWFSVSVYCPMPGYFVAMFDNITEQKLHEFQLNRVHALVLAIRRINEHLLVAKNESELFDFICNTLKSLEAISEVWIGLGGPSSDVRPVACSGIDRAYLKSLPNKWNETANGRGPMHLAIQSGSTLIFNDAVHDDRLYGISEVDTLHIRSGAAIPLAVNGEVFGAFAIWSEKSDHFDDEIVKFLNEVAVDIAVGLHALRLESDFQESSRKVKRAYQEWIDALDAVRTPIFLHDKNFLILRCNKEYQRRAGIPFKQIIGRPYFEIFPKMTAPFEHCQDSLADHQERMEEVQVDRSIYFSHVTTVTDENGDYLHSLHILEDITERRQAELELQEAQQLYNLILENAADAVYIVNSEGKFLYVNQQAVNMLGYGKAELLTMGIADVTPEEDVEEEMAMFRRFKGIGSLCRETHQKRKDGSIIPVEINAVLLPNGSFYGSCRDISERKRAEQQAADYVKQLSGYSKLLEESMRGTLQAVSSMVEQRDPYTAGHERRVGQISADIARAMGWDERKCEELQMIGLVHDIGKISVPAEILSKPGHLSAVEYDLVKQHVQRGHEILKAVKFPLPIAEIIYQHHERMDGSGYPRGLKGDDILPEARILMVADVVESISSHRPYRPALGMAVALKELEDKRGILYDADVVDALLNLVRNKGYMIGAN